MNNWNILVVEDDPDGREVVNRILKHHRIAHDTARDAEEAWELLQENDYTCAIIDLHLPGQDGWSLFQQMQTIDHLRNIECVAVTAFHSAEIAYKAVEDGFTAYFPKPLEATSFVRELESVLS